MSSQDEHSTTSGFEVSIESRMEIARLIAAKDTKLAELEERVATLAEINCAQAKLLCIPVGETPTLPTVAEMERLREELAKAKADGTAWAKKAESFRQDAENQEEAFLSVAIELEAANERIEALLERLQDEEPVATGWVHHNALKNKLRDFGSAIVVEPSNRVVSSGTPFKQLWVKLVPIKQTPS